LDLSEGSPKLELLGPWCPPASGSPPSNWQVCSCATAVSAVLGRPKHGW